MRDCPHWLISEKVKCGGCYDRNLSFKEFALIKQKKILTAFYDFFGYEPSFIDLVTPKHSSQIRDRIDFQIENRKVGLRSLDSSSTIVDIESCNLISPHLFQIYLQLKPLLVDLVPKGSFRLRLDLNQNPYLWLDLSHRCTHALFTEKRKLARLIEHCSIEWGQRKKPLALDSNGNFKLLKKYNSLPYLFQTLVKNEIFDLQMHVSDFSQPSRELNFEIIRKLNAILTTLSPKNIVEFGSGTGNLTFAIAPFASRLACFEWDTYACESWRQNLKRYQITHIKHLPKIELNNQNARAIFSDIKNNPDTVVVNPSRSGLGNFLKSITMQKVEAIIYLSCYLESFIHDMKPLESKYKCSQLICIDQFPYSHHIETLSLWVRK